MISLQDLEAQSRQLAARSGGLSVHDLRIDGDDLNGAPQRSRYAKHQALLRSYQGRYILLPDTAPGGSIVDSLMRRYDPRAIHALDALRADLEDELVHPILQTAATSMTGVDARSYVDALLPEIRTAPPSAFLAYLDTSPHRDHHYRNFLIQSSADLLAEASASALGVIGEFGAPQSALFRILIDEFGYGDHGKKHSQLYRTTMSGFGLNTEYNAYWPLWDTPALAVHNTIHCLFQSPRHFFKQVGFLLFAETAYQHSTGEHFQYLKKHHPTVDGTYFGEHAHIDIHHTRMVVDEVVAPLVDKFGPEVGHEILTGAEATRAVFAASDAHMLALARAFDSAAAAGQAQHGMPLSIPKGSAVMPEAARTVTAPFQVGGTGQILDPAVFSTFPEGSVGRMQTQE
jgi:hypothetical protein